MDKVLTCISEVEVHDDQQNTDTHPDQLTVISTLCPLISLIHWSSNEGHTLRSLHLPHLN